MNVMLLRAPATALLPTSATSAAACCRASSDINYTGQELTCMVPGECGEFWVTTLRNGSRPVVPPSAPPGGSRAAAPVAEQGGVPSQRLTAYCKLLSLWPVCACLESPDSDCHLLSIMARCTGAC